jgi:hypothetical protein
MVSIVELGAGLRGGLAAMMVTRQVFRPDSRWPR